MPTQPGEKAAVSKGLRLIYSIAGRNGVHPIRCLGSSPAGRFVHVGEVKLFSKALDLNTGVVHAPATAYRAFMFAKDFRKQGQKPDRPAVDRRKHRSSASFLPGGNSLTDRFRTRITSIGKRSSLIASSAFYPRRKKVFGIDEQATGPIANATEQQLRMMRNSICLKQCC